jgi:hypothetical protein
MMQERQGWAKKEAKGVRKRDRGPGERQRAMLSGETAIHLSMLAPVRQACDD